GRFAPGLVRRPSGAVRADCSAIHALQLFLERVLERLLHGFDLTHVMKERPPASLKSQSGTPTPAFRCVASAPTSWIFGWASVSRTQSPRNKVRTLVPGADDGDAGSRAPVRAARNPGRHSCPMLNAAPVGGWRFFSSP